MDKFFRETARSSKIETHIDKFRDVLNKETETEFINTRKLTIKTPIISESPYEASNDIDRKIFDLENLIKRLQEDIVGMYSSTEKTDEIEAVSDDMDESATASHVYPLMISDMDYPLADKSKSFENKREDLVNYNRTEDLAETFSVVRRNFAILWDDDDEISNIIAKDSTKRDEVIEYEKKDKSRGSKS